MENTGSSSGTRAKSAIRALDILDALAKVPDGLTFAELQRALGLPKSSLHELLDVLATRSYLEFDPESRAYMLGIRIWETGQAYVRHRDLLREARPIMTTIVQELNESVQLATLDGIENVYLAQIDCSHPIRLQSEVGKRLYAHATALGKMMLAQLTADELRRRLQNRSLPRFTPRTITERSALLADLAVARQRGFAINDQEYAPGLTCIAIPIHDHRGRVVAAMSASIPLMRASSEQMSLALSLLAKGGLELSRRIGYNEEDPRLVLLADRGIAAGMLRRPAEPDPYPVPAVNG